MDKRLIKQLSELINDRWNNPCSKIDFKRKINGIFSRKKNAAIIWELSDFLKSVNGREKNIYTLIIVLALLRRNLDCVDEIKDELEKNKLINCLYGGLCILLSGKSEMISIRIELNDNLFENKYEFITHFVDFNYYDYIEMFQAVEILYLSDAKKFESLISRDETKLLLLNIASGHMSVKLSNSFISDLLKDDDELNRNIGFSLLTTPIYRTVSSLEFVEREKSMGIKPRMSERKLKNSLKTYVAHVDAMLEQCSNNTKVSLIINYLLVFKRNKYPGIFAYRLMDSEVQDEFVFEIKESNKLRTLEEVSFILEIISKTSIKNNSSLGLSKNPLYDAIVDIIINFINNNRGIYNWGKAEKQYFLFICRMLPVRYKNKLKSFLINESKKLMATDFDKLVRLNIYLKDVGKKKIIDGMLREMELL